MVNKTFSFSKGIKTKLGTRVVGGDTISFDTGDLIVTFLNWETLTAAQQQAIVTEMQSRGLEATD